jgi:hypothetical protein
LPNEKGGKRVCAIMTFAKKKINISSSVPGKKYRFILLSPALIMFFIFSKTIMLENEEAIVLCTD